MNREDAKAQRGSKEGEERKTEMEKKKMADSNCRWTAADCRLHPASTEVCMTYVWSMYGVCMAYVRRMKGWELMRKL